jgi:hypothetical protein
MVGCATLNGYRASFSIETYFRIEKITDSVPISPTADGATTCRR